MDSDTTITATAPAHAAGPVSVLVETVGGTSEARTFTYVAAPTLTSLSPGAGPTSGGGSVTLTGTNLSGASSVTFGGLDATTYSVDSDTTITATAPAHAAGPVSVLVETVGGTSEARTFTYVAAPTLTSLSPGAGPTSGGGSVTLTGTNLSGASSVTFGGLDATTYSVDSDTTITATAPAHAAGPVSVLVETVGGTSEARTFTYVAAPTLTSLSPGAGPTSGGGSVTLTGTNLSGASSVTFGGLDATTYSVDSDTTITATAPAHAAGPVSVLVETVGGTSEARTFTYVAAPTLTSLSPGAGPTSGGGSVTLTGTNLSGASSVTFGGLDATTYSVDSDTTITATAPAHAAGPVSVLVETVGGTSEARTFTYVAAPTLTSLSPGAGPTSGGGSVTLTGTNLSGASSVTFGGLDATTYSVDSDTTITATAPAHAAGPVSVLVETVGGTSEARTFTYVAAPTLTSLSPGAGPTSGGGSVTLTGTNLSGASSVTFGGLDATTYSVDSDTTITATAPAHAAGPVSVLVETVGGTSEARTFTYVAAPTLTSLSPGAGPTSGGGSVTLTGTNLSGASSVTFGGLDATTYSVDSDTTITATAPAHAAGPVSVLVETVGGTSEARTFTYVAAPTLTSLSPGAGPTSGGGSVTLTGTNLSGASSVTFGGLDATTYSVDSDTTITATAPAHAAGPVSVLVETVGGTSEARTFTYVAAPTLTSLSPGAGPTSGGGSVTLTGTNLSGASSVTFGGLDATTYSVDSDTTITATAPAHAAGPVSVLVETVGGTSEARTFTYVAAPTLTSLSPGAGPTSGGGSVTLTGTNLSGASSVTFGGLDATVFYIYSATEIRATAPAHNAGTVNVQVATVGGSSDTSGTGDNYTYEAPTPTRYDDTDTHLVYSGAWGPVSAGAAYAGAYTRTNTSSSSINIYFNGSRLDWIFTKDSSTGKADVYLDSDPVPTTVDLTGTGTGYQRNVYSTGDLAGGLHRMRITPSTKIPTGKYITFDAVDVVGSLVPAPPTISSLSPNSGPAAGGNSVVINGTGFTELSGASAVTFGGTNAASYAVNAAKTQITAVAPAHALGVVDVVVTTAGGPNSNTANDNYTYAVVAARYEQTDAHIVYSAGWSTYPAPPATRPRFGRQLHPSECEYLLGHDLLQRQSPRLDRNEGDDHREG